MNAESAGRSVAFVGDVHLDRDDSALDEFLAFLQRLGRRHGTIVLLGDLFNIWLGRRGLAGPHHRAVADTLAGLRRSGVRVCYVEGNRDFHIGDAYLGSAFDEVRSRCLREQAGPTRIVAVHGDLANREDRQYRLWNRFARSRFVWRLFNLLPEGRRVRLAEGLARRLRSTNLRYRGGFPEEAVRAYAGRLLRSGCDAVVLGHFHVEKDLSLEVEGRRARVLVLPEWKGSRRHLEALADGSLRFVDSTPD